MISESKFLDIDQATFRCIFKYYWIDEFSMTKHTEGLTVFHSCMTKQWSISLFERLWLVPRPSPDIPVGEIGYTSALPGRQTSIMQGQYESNIQVSEGVRLPEMITNLNKQIMKSPLPGL